ncbi:hypothetical protein J6TS2_10240 [Heyndrickxia sporothermodurans]|nr:hypothetical protein J6TS2_10240 [Heyndrickxia sporothermodurans]
MRKKITGEVFQQIVIFTAGIGMFLSTLDSGIINVALSELAQTFPRYHYQYYMDYHLVYISSCWNNYCFW